MRLLKAQSKESTKLSEEAFLNSLIGGFEDAFKELQNKEPKDRLEAYDKYSKIYYKLKAPMSGDCKALVKKGVNDAIYEISDRAIKENNKSVAEFLSSHADEIVESIGIKYGK